MKKFEVGKRYNDTDNNNIEIEVLKRTETTITFKFVNPAWWSAYVDVTKTFRKKVSNSQGTFELIALDNSYSAPRIMANS